MPDRKGEANIHIAVPPDQLYAMVADVTRTPEWSPETHTVEWRGDTTRAEPGARFVGRNRFGWIRWSMTCVIETAEPGRELSWSTMTMGRKVTRWTYRFEPRDGGTQVTESYTEVAKLPSPVSAVVGVMFRRHDEWMPENVRRSLERLKAVAESGSSQASTAAAAPAASEPATT
jgi:uncharacterized protein YndB with AHSA1/START domain